MHSPEERLQSVISGLGTAPQHVVAIAGDGSSRRYYRVAWDDRPSQVVMLPGIDEAKAMGEGRHRWTAIQSLLLSHGVPVPRIESQFPGDGGLSLEDLGDLDLSEALSGQNDRLALLEGVFPLLLKFLTIETDERFTDVRFSASVLAGELQFFRRHFLEGTLGWSLDARESSRFDEECFDLSRFLANKSNFFVHRDFHSRNLMAKDNKLWVIDFQDARLGPPAYDLVSLVFDSYLDIGEPERLQLLMNATSFLHQHLPPSTFSALADSWRATLAQRQLKALGSFGYLSGLGKPRDYLRSVPRALGTLSPERIYDPRWPLLTVELPGRMTKAWAERTST